MLTQTVAMWGFGTLRWLLLVSVIQRSKIGLFFVEAIFQAKGIFRKCIGEYYL